MSATDPAPHLPSRTWRDPYLAALFEVDDGIASARIEEAEKAIVARTRELFTADDGCGERRALHSAGMALRALRS